MTDLSIQVQMFAKANKISKAKLEEFISGILAQSKPVARIGGGKSAKSSTLELRHQFKNYIQQNTGKQITSRIVADTFHVSLADAGNVLKYYASNGAQVKAVGVQEHQGRGKRTTIWQVIG